MQEFNARSRNVKVVFVNQFGFEQKVCGLRMPADMEFMDIRKGSDAEFGQSIYEPFGIAQVEPISFGGICVFSNVCGCAGFVDKASDGKPTPNVIVADYTDLPDKSLRPDATDVHRPARARRDRAHRGRRGRAASWSTASRGRPRTSTISSSAATPWPAR